VSIDSGADIVVKNRDGSDTQRWATDRQPAKPRSLSIAGGPSTTPATTEPPSVTPARRQEAPPTAGA
jgi:hypothetical protein